MRENDGDEMTLETEYAALDAEMLERDAPPGESSAFAFPACGGVQSRARFEEFAREAREQAELIRRLLAGNGSGSDG